MFISTAEIYRHPNTQGKMKLIIDKQSENTVVDGKFISDEGDVFNIINGIVDFTWPKQLDKLDHENRLLYDSIAEDYEKFAKIPFMTYKCDERDVREDIVKRLRIKPDSKVLEVGCGCGDGSIYIAEKLGPHGQLFLQELSEAFLCKAIKKTANKKCQIEYAIANASYLSFPDNFFDAAHHFGGLNTFSDIKRFLHEIVRVVKPGGKIIVGDEGIGPWLRNTQFYRIMANSNPLLKYDPPHHLLPPQVKNVKIEWIMMSAFYLIEFEVASSEPEANYHIPIPSKRGGTHWTRYHGNLEGVTDEAKIKAIKAAEISGLSIHEWLDNTIKKQVHIDGGDKSEN